MVHFNFNAGDGLPCLGSSGEYSIEMGRRGRKPKANSNRWFVYVLKCADGTFYTGIAKDVNCRLQKHKNGTASRYTRSRLPAVVVYREAHASQSSALKREAAIKSLSRQEKISLIRQPRE